MPNTPPRHRVRAIPEEDDRNLRGLIAMAIEALRMFEPKGIPYYGLFSGGKDSIVLKELTRLSGVSCEWIHNITGIDPPEVVGFIRKNHPDVQMRMPERPFYASVEKRGLPMRRTRWCCHDLKERTLPAGRTTLFGIRWQESSARRGNWRLLTYNVNSRAFTLLPILHWADLDIWHFIRTHKLPYPSLYDEGFKRVGCWCCPYGAPARLAHIARHPKLKIRLLKAVQAWWLRREQQHAGDAERWWGTLHFRTPAELLDWWISDAPTPDELEPCANPDLAQQ